MEALRGHLQARVPQPHRRHHRLPRLGRDEIARIVDIQLARLRKLLAEREPAARARRRGQGPAWPSEGYDPAFGARPLKRAIQRYLQDPLAREIIAGRFCSGDVIEVDRDGDEIVFRTVVYRATASEQRPPPPPQAREAPRGASLSESRAHSG